MLIGKTLRAARKRLAITQQEAADYVGVSRATISRMEHDTYTINSTELARLTDLYHLTLGELLSGDIGRDIP